MPAGFAIAFSSRNLIRLPRASTRAKSFNLFRRVLMSSSLNTAQQYLDKGLVFYNKGWLDEAVSSYRMAIQMREGNFPRAYYQLARALLDMGDMDGAIEAFRTS